MAGRAAGTRGPFVDKRGISLMSGGGSLVLAANGNRWLSTGHGSQVTDLAGGDWLAFHAVPRSRPYLDAAAGAERRSLLLDRIRWRDGWPLVRAGRWASQRPQRAPVTTWDVGETFGADTSQEDWVKHGGRWRFLDDRVRGSIASCREAYLTSSETISGSQRVEADLRTIEERAAVGLVAAFGDSHRRAVAWIDDAFDEFLLSVEEGGALFVTRAVLPPGFRPDRFHRVVLELNGPRLKATLLDAGDAVAVLHALNLARRDSKRSIGVAVACGSGEAANVGGTRLRRDPAPSVRLPSIGKPVARLGDEFDGDELAPTWSWVREPAGETGHGVFRWRTQVGDLGASDTASVLLRAAPRGRFTVETKLRMSSVEGAEVSSPHAGLIAYRSDDLHVMLTRGHPEARPIVFAKDLVTHGIREHGAMPVTRSAKVTWLRLVHRVDPHNGEHQYRSAVSPDGAHWDWGATWTLPRGRDPRIGLVSLGGRGAIARFDYFRVLRP